MPDAATPQATPGRPYGRLRQRHPSYNEEQLQRIEALYVGGWAMQEKAKSFTPKLVGEHPERYDARCKMTSYQPYFGQIIDGFVSDLFNQPLTMKPVDSGADAPTYYTDLANDADREGTPFVEVMGDALSAALRKRRGIIAIDAPALDPNAPPPVTKADEEKEGLDRLYVYELPVEQIIDWRMDKKNKSAFAWCIRWEKTQEREDPDGDREYVTETFTVWTMTGTGKDARARWQRYVIRYKEDDKPADTANVPLVDEDVTNFDRIPLIPRDLPPGLWVGNKIGTQALEHFQRRSALVGAENNSLVAIPFIAKGSEIGASGGPIPSDAQQNPDRGNNPKGQFDRKGWVEIGSGDTLGFAEPTGACYDLVDKQLDDLRKDMFAVNFQMAASVRPSPGSMARSGKSKEKDGEATAKVLRKLGSEVRHWAVQVFNTISRARKEPITWAAHGLDTFESDSREEVLEEAVVIDQIAIPSATFKKAHKKKVARQLLENSDPDTFAKIDKEIDKGVDESEKHEDLEREAERAALDAKKDIAEHPQSHEPAPVTPPKAKGPPAPKPGAGRAA